jgi:hypothetical protein
VGNQSLIIVARYPRFYKAARGVLTEALQRLQHALGTDHPQWPTQEARRIVFENEGRSSLQSEQVEDPASALTPIFGELSRSESYSIAVQELSTIKEQGPGFPDIFGGGTSYLFPLISNYLKTHRALSFDEKRFGEAYYPIEEYLAANFVKVRLYMTLPGLEGDVDEVILSPTHRIYRLDDVEINRLWRIVEPPGYAGFMRTWVGRYPHVGSYMFSATIQYPKNDLNELSLILTNEEAKTKKALRLSAPGGGVVAWFTYEHIQFAAEFGRLGFGDITRHGAYTYRLSRDTAESLTSHWRAAYGLSEILQTNPEKAPTDLRISALRFSGSSEKISPEDQLVDFAIALEALLTKENDAISYRLPLRGSMVAGDTPDERTRAFTILKATYDIRSALAHGQDQLTESPKVGKERLPIKLFMDELRTILFKILHRFIQARKKTQSKDKILKMIDESIITMNRDELQGLWQ